MADRVAQDTSDDAARRTLEKMGYTYHGGELWKPPIGPKPNFDLNNRLHDALRLCLIGGNHLAVHIDLEGPNWRADPDAGLTHYGAGPSYDAWCCWRAIMRAREMAYGSDPILPQMTATERGIWAVKEAYRFYIDASDDELADYGLSRDDALALARKMDRVLPDGLRDDGMSPWARENLPRAR